MFRFTWRLSAFWDHHVSLVAPRNSPINQRAFIANSFPRETPTYLVACCILTMLYKSPFYFLKMRTLAVYPMETLASKNPHRTISLFRTIHFGTHNSSYCLLFHLRPMVTIRLVRPLSNFLKSTVDVDITTLLKFHVLNFLANIFAF